MNNLRYNKQVVRTLKRLFGLRAIFRVETVGSRDLKTGVATVSQSDTIVRLAILMPITHAVYQAPVPGVFKGGLVEVGTRLIIIDARDIPDYSGGLHPKIVIGGDTYEIVKDEMTEDRAAYTFTVKKI